MTARKPVINPTRGPALPGLQRRPAPERLAGVPPAGQIPGHWNLSGRTLESMAISEQQQAGIYVKVAATLMVLMLAYGALQLAGFMR
jgi:hypothetical protein